MAKYTQEQETEIVRDAAELTAIIEIESEKLKELESQSYSEKPPVLELPQKPNPPAKPIEPVKQTHTSQNRIAGAKEKFEFMNARGGCLKPLLVWIFGPIIGGLLLLTGNPIMAILGLLIVILTFILPIITVIKRSKQNNADWVEAEKALNEQYASEDRAQYEQKLAESQIKYDEEMEYYNNVLMPKYAEELERYNSITIPEYEQEVAHRKEQHERAVQEYQEGKKTWLNQQNGMIEWLKGDINYNKVTLEELYEETNIISVYYRELWILRWLYNDMSSSDHDIRYATELLDRDRQRRATEQSAQMVREAVNEMTDIMVDQFNYIGAEIRDGNMQLYNMGETLMEMEMLGEDSYELLKKTRRDNNFANLTSIYQRYKYNKSK